MATSIQDVEAAALDLSAEDRAELAQRLLSSLDRDPKIEAAWNKEICERVADLEAGRVTTIPEEEIFAKARLRSTP